MRRHRKAGHPVQPHWETRDTTSETAFCWVFLSTRLDIRRASDGHCAD